MGPCCSQTSSDERVYPSVPHAEPGSAERVSTKRALPAWTIPEIGYMVMRLRRWGRGPTYWFEKSSGWHRWTFATGLPRLSFFRPVIWIVVLVDILLSSRAGLIVYAPATGWSARYCTTCRHPGRLQAFQFSRELRCA